MKKTLFIVLILIFSFCFSSCLKEKEECINQIEELSYTDGGSLPTEAEICSVPLMPTDTESTMLRAAYRAMNDIFGGATVENQEVIEIGEIYGERCKRYYIETSKGDFVAVVNKSGKIVGTWSEGEKKNLAFRFPQFYDINVSSDENLGLAYHIFYDGGYHDDDIICDFKQEPKTDKDGKTVWEVVLYSTHCTETYCFDEFGRMVSRTK